MITARKWVAVGFGGPEVLRNIEADVPDPGPGQVTIGVRACGMNPADAKHIAPGQDPMLLPLSIGYEVAGVVTALGPDRHDRRQPRRHLTEPKQAMTVRDKAARPARLPDRPYPSSLPENQRSGKLLPQGDTLEPTREVGPVLSDLRGLFNDLVRFEIEFWNAVDARLKSEFGLPLTHFEPMSVMDRIAGCRVYDIANELGITTGGTSKLVDRIEASGYCRRLPNPDDRRSSLLELTEEGRRLFAKAGVAFDDELQRRVGAALPERTLRQFASTLSRLRIASRRLGMEESA